MATRLKLINLLHSYRSHHISKLNLKFFTFIPHFYCDKKTNAVVLVIGKILNNKDLFTLNKATLLFSSIYTVLTKLLPVFSSFQ